MRSGVWFVRTGFQAGLLNESADAINDPASRNPGPRVVSRATLRLLNHDFSSCASARKPRRAAALQAQTLPWSGPAGRIRFVLS
jgi:hypothetical protein